MENSKAQVWASKKITIIDKSDALAWPNVIDEVHSMKCIRENIVENYNACDVCIELKMLTMIPKPLYSDEPVFTFELLSFGSRFKMVCEKLTQKCISVTDFDGV